MYIDSHCHLNFPQLSQKLPEVLARMTENQVDKVLAISVSRTTFDEVYTLAQAHDNIYASVGIHPDDPETSEFSLEELIERASWP